MDGYKLLDFQQNSICYALKPHDPQQNRHSTRKTSKDVKQEVIRSPRIKRVVDQVAKKSGDPVEAVQLEANAILDEIAHKMALPAVRTLASFLRSVLVKIVQAIYVNVEGLEQLKQTLAEWPSILLPSHRSYLDFILVSYLMFEHNITLPCIAAGQDFMSMRGVSPLLRRSGAFFLRRTFGSDQLYKAVFSEYVKAVLYSGDHPLEFFVEGTRSRSGKSLHPKLGLLSTVMEPYLEGRLPDIMLIPISISYERTLEETLYARELLGVPKPKESTTALVRARSILSEDYGSIYVHIGTALSLHAICQQYGISRVPHSLQPRDVSMLLPGDWKVASEVGATLLGAIHEGMKVFPTSLVATALLQQPAGLHFDDMVILVQWIANQVLVCGGQLVELKPDFRKVVLSGLCKLSQVVHTSADNYITIASPTAATTPKQQFVRPFSLEDILQVKMEDVYFKELCEVAYYHLHLAYYRNQLLHLFVEDAMVAVCMASAEVDYNLLSTRFSALHCGLASEFILPSKPPHQLLEEVTGRLIDRGLLGQSISPEGKQLVFLQTSHSKTVHFLQQLLLPFVSGVWVVCQHLLSLRGGVQTLTATVKASQQLAAKCLYYSVLKSYEILSLGTIKNTINSLHRVGMILQASNEFGTGKDRLVKVILKNKLIELTETLGTIVLPQCKGTSKL